MSDLNLGVVVIFGLIGCIAWLSDMADSKSIRVYLAVLLFCPYVHCVKVAENMLLTYSNLLFEKRHTSHTLFSVLG